MKKLVLAFGFLALTSQAFAVQYCKIKGTEDTVGIFPGDMQRKPSIYVKNRGYYVITDYKSNVYISERADRSPVILDFNKRTLTIDEQVIKLVRCIQNGTE